MKAKDYTKLPFSRYRLTHLFFNELKTIELAAPSPYVAALLCNPYGYIHLTMHAEEIPGEVSQAEKEEVNTFLNTHFVVSDCTLSCPADVIKSIETDLMRNVFLQDNPEAWEKTQALLAQYPADTLTLVEYENGTASLNHNGRPICLRYDNWYNPEEEVEIQEIQANPVAKTRQMTAAEAALILCASLNVQTEELQANTENPNPPYLTTIKLALLLITIIGCILTTQDSTRIIGLHMAVIGGIWMLVACTTLQILKPQE